MLQIIATEKEEGLVIGTKAAERKISAEILLIHTEVKEISKSR